MTNYVAISSILSLLLGAVPAQVSAFSVPMFKEQVAMQRTTPSKTEGVEIELPDFDELFGRIQEVSPLASMALDGERGGFGVADSQYTSNLKWKKIEANKNKLVHKIDKIDNFQGLGCPIVRFRSTIEGPCLGMKFVEYIMDVEERRVYDPQIEVVEQAYPAYDIAAANMG
eukprot:766790_1